jgi:hypothetical protein
MGIWKDLGFNDRHLTVAVFMYYLVDRDWDDAVVLKN